MIIKKNNLLPKAPEPYVLEETFLSLFKSSTPKHSFDGNLKIKIIPPKNKDGIIPRLPETPEPEYINEVFTIFPKSPVVAHLCKKCGKRKIRRY